MSPANLSRRMALLLAVGAAYYGAGKLGLSLAFVNASATAVWPPAGIALAALLLFGNQVWPAILVGAFLVNLTTAGTVTTSIAIAAGNTLEGLLGAFLVRRFASGTRVFEQPQDILKFAGLASVSAMLGATIGVATLALGGLASGPSLARTWLTWWLGDTAAVLVVGPPLILWGLSARIEASRRFMLEAALLLLAVVASGLLVFSDRWGISHGNFPLHFLCVPPLLWAAFSFTQRETATALLLTSAIAVWGTLRGAGPFGLYDPQISLLLLQAFMTVTAVTMLPLAAAVAERRRIELRIRQLNQGLEQRVSDATRRLRATNDELRNQMAERERAAKDLQRSEARLREAQQVARIGSWEWDIGRNVVWWSEQLYEIFGLQPAEFGASYEAYLERVHPEDREVTHATVQNALRDRKAYTFEHRVVRPDGRIIHLFARGRVVCDPTGVPIRMLGTGQDMTERLRIEEERAALLRQQIARREAEQANEFKDQFLATVSHELRNPLNAIIGWARLLRDGDLEPAEKQRGIEAINRNADLQSQLILDLLDHSRVTAGRLELRQQLVGLASIIEQAVEAVRPAARDRQIAIEARLEAPGACVWGDPHRLQQVTSNLLANAIRFIPEGGRIEVSLSHEAEHAVLRVADDGPGIDPEFLPHVFESFRRGTSRPARRQSGLGLGLAIVRQLVELHGGTVRATNRPEGGAVFEVRLQLAGTRAEAPWEPTPTEAAAPINGSLDGLRVLLVDDDVDTGEVLRLMLDGHGASLDITRSCAEALTRFEASRPDLIISDIDLADDDGYELLRRIRSRPPEDGGAVAAIALTACARPEDACAAIRCGYQVHLAKPFEGVQLMRIIRDLTRPAPVRT
ncbi:MAG TPA: MASE1 domain-containing protein [Candidatus Eisenbacteria bacterium]|nr:MASE1 domain-containing protein [Candidatus Eisenbacteria bacterium]